MVSKENAVIFSYFNIPSAAWTSGKKCRWEGKEQTKRKKIYRNANEKNDEVSAVQHMELTPMTMWRISALFTIYIVDFIQSRGIRWWKNQGNTQKIRGNERNWMESIPNFECILNRNHVDLHMKPWRYWVDDGD